MPIFGIVVPTSEIRLPAGAVTAVAAQAQHLDTNWITCDFWTWQGSYGGLTTLWQLWVFMAALFFLLAGLVYLQYHGRTRRVAMLESELQRTA